MARTDNLPIREASQRLANGVRLLVLLAPLCAWGEEAVHTVPYVPSASSQGHVGIVRVESRSAVSGEVRVVAVDDAGQRVDAGVLSLRAHSAVEFEVPALESGDASLGLTGTGPGEGDWRLELTTELDIDGWAYARTEGFLTALHDSALVTGGEVEMPFFNPASEMERRSLLRLTNAGAEPATLTVRGIDDPGESVGAVTVDLGAWEARSYSAAELESGAAAGLAGSLGDGEGKWRLRLSADAGSAYATNLLLDGSGVLASVPGGMSRDVFHRVPLFPSASDGEGHRGLVRVVNRAAKTAVVGIEAFDATDRAYEELELTLDGDASGQFDSSDLERGNAERGLEGSTGPGEGDWWLELSSGSEIEVLPYLDKATGPQLALRGTRGKETETGVRYEVLLRRESGELRMLNAGGEPVEVRVTGTDDAGASSGEVALTLSPWTMRVLGTTALEEGEAALVGTLGPGAGSWRLVLDADRELDVLSLVRGSGGMLSDVSRRYRPAGTPPRTEVVDAVAQRQPDLWASARASKTALSTGEAFELQVTVGNRGGAEAPATTLRYYRSTNAAIARSDSSIGTDTVAALGASASSAESIDLTAPSEPGTHYYGACVDTVADESDTANNCSPAVAVKVAEPSPQPDLEVSASVTGSPPPGGSFVLEASVRNRGAGDAAATTLRYYRSPDAAIARWDTPIGTDTVAALGASGGSAESIDLTAPSEPGTYYYGACVDAVADESNTANNCSPAVAVTVRDPVYPDLSVGMPSVNESSVEPGDAFTLSTTVTNLGGADAAATTLRYYRSTDATIARSDASVGTDAVAMLGASGSSAGSIELTAPSDPGTYHYGACVDAVADESNTENNCSTAVAVNVEEPAYPDLAVGTSTVNENSPKAGAKFMLSATVTNRGNGGSEATTLRYYRSTDATITTSDTSVGTDAVRPLAASGGSAESIDLTAPATAGTYYYGACVDAVTNESDTANNCSPSVAVTVAEPGEGLKPDLAASAYVGGSPAPGGSFVLEAGVRNLGAAAAPATTLRYYSSTDATITTSDTSVGTDEVPALGVKGSSVNLLDLSIDLTAPSDPGTYYYGACVDAVADESDTANNCSSAVEVDVAYFGAVSIDAYGVDGKCKIRWGLVIDQLSNETARNLAMEACLIDPIPEGARDDEPGCNAEYTGSFRHCQAVVRGGEDGIICWVMGASGQSTSEAEANGIENCESLTSNCSVVTSLCNTR